MNERLDCFFMKPLFVDMDIFDSLVADLLLKIQAIHLSWIAADKLTFPYSVSKGQIDRRTFSIDEKLCF